MVQLVLLCYYYCRLLALAVIEATAKRAVLNIKGQHDNGSIEAMKIKSSRKDASKSSSSDENENIWKCREVPLLQMFSIVGLCGDQ